MQRRRVTKAKMPMGYSFKFESSDSEPDDRLVRRQVAQSTRGIKLIPRSSSGHEARRLTKQAQIRPARIFTPQDDSLTPEQHFPQQTVAVRTPFPRFVNRFNSKEMMLVVDGSCTNNGAGIGRNPQTEEGAELSAGASFIYKDGPRYIAGGHGTTLPFLAAEDAQIGGAPLGDVTIPMPDMTGKIAIRLEQQGPRGDVQRHTSNRAKLRAVIAALEFRPWYGEGWQSIVIVTDLEYVVKGATIWLPMWAKRRWRASIAKDRKGRVRFPRKIANRDLWEEFQTRVDTLRANGTEVAFWLIPSKSMIRKDSALIGQAKESAREAARCQPGVVVEEYTKLCGLFV